MQTIPATDEWSRALRRPHQGRLIAGVAAGVADHFDVDVVLVRVALVVLTVAAGVGVPAYLAAWLLIPDEGQDESAVEHLLGHGAGAGMGWCCGPPPSATTMASAPGRTAGPGTQRSDDVPAS